MPRRIETLFIPGAAGRLESIIEEPEEQEPIEAALVCHPHPQHGGTMHNKVVHRLARGLRRAGCVVLRFNYRGVNLSEGAYGHMKGEVEDARVALAELRSRYPQLPVLLGGFSFGSRVILHVAASDHNVSRTIAVGFPTKYPNSDFVHQIRVPKFFIQSTHDAFGPREELQRFFDSLPEPKQLSWIEASDHFFRDSLDAYEAEVFRVGSLR